MFLFDLHCDTITECLRLNKSLIDNDLHIDITRGNDFDKWVQTFAFWIDDIYKGDDAYNIFVLQRDLLLKEIENNKDKLCLYKNGDEINKGRCSVIMAVEGGHVLGGDINKIEQLKKLGVSYLTLVWNVDNELGCGAKGSETGLTDFGKLAVKELERCNIIVDVSHLNEAGFEDVCALATKPIIATHSNARVIHNNKRNLYDKQLTYLIEHNGLCGINFFTEFINGKNDCDFDDIKRHVDHILSLGGENILALGSDFDGARMPTILNGVQTLYTLYENMLKWYNSDVANKIFYNNAKLFVDQNITIDKY